MISPLVLAGLLVCGVAEATAAASCSSLMRTAYGRLTSIDERSRRDVLRSMMNVNMSA